jgi:hypothetical protein
MSLVPVDRYEPSPAPTVSNQWIELVAPAASLANQIAQTEFVPKEFRNKPDAITACVLYGAELGLGPMVSLSKIAVIQGKPAPYAELGRALALAAGHEVWVKESTNTRVTVCGRRKGSNHVQEVTWTLDDVKKAGISNHNYSKYPRQMLLARASAELVRAMCPDVLGGIAVFAEEAADIDDDGPTIVAGEIETKPKTTRKRRDPKPADEPTDDAEVAEPEADAPSEAQTKMAMAGFNEVGIGDRGDRLAATAAFVGHPVDSWSTLTRSEASTVIDGLERIKDGSYGFAIADDGMWSITVAQETLLENE